MKENIRHIVSRAEAIKVRNALNPMLLLTAVTTTPALGFAWLSGFDLAAGLLLVALAGLPPIFTIAAFFILLFRDPAETSIGGVFAST